jgi:hypothetical protein
MLGRWPRERLRAASGRLDKRRGDAAPVLLSGGARRGTAPAPNGASARSQPPLGGRSFGGGFRLHCGAATRAALERAHLDDAARFRSGRDALHVGAGRAAEDDRHCDDHADGENSRDVTERQSHD